MFEERRPQIRLGKAGEERGKVGPIGCRVPGEADTPFSHGLVVFQTKAGHWLLLL